MCTHPLKNILICVIYRQPNDSANGHPSSNKELSEVLDKLKNVIIQLQSPTPDIIILGDINLPHVLPNTWKHGFTKRGIPQDETNMIGSIQGIIDEFFLEQLIDKPTHQDGNILDLIFTNNTDILHSFTCTETTFSDHHIINCKSTYTQTKNIDYNTPASSEEKQFESLNFFSEL